MATAKDIIIVNQTTSQSETFEHVPLYHPAINEGARLLRTPGRGKLIVADNMGFQDCPYTHLDIELLRSKLSMNQCSFIEQFRVLGTRVYIYDQDTAADRMQPWPMPRTFQGYIGNYSEGWLVNRKSWGVKGYKLMIPVDEAYDYAAGDLIYSNIMQVSLDAPALTVFDAGSFAGVARNDSIVLTPYWRKHYSTTYAWTFPVGFSSTSITTEVATVTTPNSANTWACSAVFTNANGASATFNFDIVTV